MFRFAAVTASGARQASRRGPMRDFAAAPRAETSGDPNVWKET
jgi:hypothetical protein